MTKTTCSRCKGTGTRNCARAHLGVPGLCFDCNGDGTKATQLATKAAEKESKRLNAIQLAVSAKIWEVREANGGSAIPPRERRHEVYKVFENVRGFSTQDYADRFDLTKAEAWVELCRWAMVYPYFVGESAVGWTLSY